MKRIVILLALFLIAVIIITAWWNNGIKPVNPNDKTAHIFVVKKGAGVREIASDLKGEGIIKDPIVFFLLTKKTGLDKKIQAGDFRLNPSMTAQEVANALTHGTLDIWVTIPEGKRADEIADEFKEKLPTYNELWRPKLVSNEGYLFPDTYLIPRDATVDIVINLMRGNFDKKYESVKMLNNNNLSDSEIVIVASLIEREAKFAKDQPMVASVIENRLNIGMALQIDATVQYALNYQEDTKSWWKKELTADDLKINSAYNTYKNAGLPPTPISNPGLSAIKSALNPAKTDYLYYISDPSGNLRYSTTLEGHNQNIKNYGL